MKFEKVHTIRDFYDGVRSGTANLGGNPHYFASNWDDQAEDYADHFRLYPVSTQFMERELRYWEIFLAWQDRFHRGLAPQETRPGHRGVDSEYDELNRWLDEQIKLLEPVRSLYTATFRAIADQGELPAGIFRKLEVAWQSAGALEQ